MEPQRDAHVFALTGGIGSGKSRVAALWREHGLPVVDADQIAREVVHPGRAGHRAIRDHFGPEVFEETGELDRKRLAQRIFGDDSAREQLNALLHPLIREEAERHFSRIAHEGHTLIAYEVPLLFETGQQERFRPVVVVSAPVEAQIARVLSREETTEAAVRERIRAQFPLERKEALADFVIDNSGAWERAQERALDVLERVRASFEDATAPRT